MHSDTTNDYGVDMSTIFPTLPPSKRRSDHLAHAPVRRIDDLSAEDKILALRNALRYFPIEWHSRLASEFADELNTYGRIYMYRFMPDEPLFAKPIDQYKSRSQDAAAIMLMIDNNLDPLVAKYPEELITYGGNGAVFQNWAQYHLVMHYLSRMDDTQTLVLYSGHPMGLFPSHTYAPRVIVTNGMMIPNYSSKADWNRFNALGVTQYGQMTAGSFMYIGPQGIVHGTTITLMNAGRLRQLGQDNLAGILFVTSGLGGMSGAQSIAAVITGATCIIAEVDPSAIDQRVRDGYIEKKNVYDSLDLLLPRAKSAKSEREAVTLVYYGNVVDLWEALAESDIVVELGSDQTSLHNIDDLGYCPVGYSFEEAARLLNEDHHAFHSAVRETLCRHVEAINQLADRGMYFWDYGNAFLKEAAAAGADIFHRTERDKFRYASYVEDIMGPMCFDYGFGPFRWVCTSSLESDLYRSDEIAAEVLRMQLDSAPQWIHGQLLDNLHWIQNARHNLPIVGSKSRILYADADGRIAIARAFNQAIANGELRGPVVLGRDHHDVSGTDSPYRETANIYDGSQFTADMAVHNVIGDACRGASWVSLHNGGGVGWGEVINGGFGLVLDGSDLSETRLERMLYWDVYNGVARRSWAGNPGAVNTIGRAMESNDHLCITRFNQDLSLKLSNYFDEN